MSTMTAPAGRPRLAHAGPGTAPPARQILSKAQSGRGVIQDFVALPESLEWEDMLPSLSDDVVPFIR